MKRILGLDLGTASIGWAVVNQATEADGDNQSNIVRIGVRVNPLTVDEKQNFEAGKSITTNADRTLKRSMRRNLQRYKLRRNALIDILRKNSFISSSTILSEDGNNTTFQTYRLRAKAVTEEITLEQLARVLLMINKKRGYKSSRKAKNEDEGQLIDGMSIAKQLYNEGITPGQYTLALLESGKRYVPSYYRSDLVAELNRIWEFQKNYYPDLLTDSTRQAISGKSRKATSGYLFSVHHISIAEVKDKKLRLLTPCRWRVEALSKRLDIDQLGTVICDINGAISSASGYLGSISDRSKELYFNNVTIGQYLYQNIEANPHYRVKNKVFYRQDYLNEFEAIWENQAKYHPELTPDLKAEIRDVVIFYQRKLKSQKGLISFCEFEQRTISVNEGGKVRQKTVGLRVCPKSSPLYQESRIWQSLNNVMVTDGNTRTSRQLTNDERSLLYNELCICDSLKKSEMLKLLDLAKKGDDYSLNFESIKGNTTMAKIFNCCLTVYEMTGHDAESLRKMKTADDKIATMKRVFSALGYSTDFLNMPDFSTTESMQQSAMFRLWHLLYSYIDDKSATGNENLIKHISQLTGFEKEYASVLAGTMFEQDYGSLSAKAIMKILPYLQAGEIYSDACQSAGYRHSADSLTKEEIENRQLKGHLNILPKGALRNPVVEKILNQMINVVNELNSQYGKIDPATGLHYFDEIHIELARELKKSASERESATESLNKNTKDNERIRKIVADILGTTHVSRNDIIRYRLYEELAKNGYNTLYSNTHISDPKQIFSADFDIEHIIPQSRLFNDSISNKTLETRDINRIKGNRTAYDFVKEEYGNSEENNINQYLARIKYLDKDGTRAKYKNLITQGCDIPSDFINRDLRDTQYIARKAKELLYDITRVVVSTTGSITDRLRDDWGLVDALKELNWEKYDALGLTEVFNNRDGHQVRRIKNWTKRNDHRHHAMDALTIAFTKPSHIQYLNNLNARSDKAGAIYAIECKELHRDKKDNHLIFNPPFSDIRHEALRQLGNILVSIKAKNKVTTINTNISTRKGGVNKVTQLTPRGQLHNETVYGKQLIASVNIEKVGSTFDAEKISTVCSPSYREALMNRLNAFGGDAKKAFTGANSLEKKPLYLNADHSKCVPAQVKTKIYTPVLTIRKAITPDLKVDNVLDEGIKRILKARLDAFGGDAKSAFSNLSENPIWLNEDKGICIECVTIKGVNVATALHEKKDKDGNPVLDTDGNRIPTDYVSTSNNHHVAIFEDADGNYQEHIVSFFEATTSTNLGMPVVDKNYRNGDGWKFLFTMKRNEYFVFPEYRADSEEMIFNPSEIDLMNPDNFAEISKHLYRVQKLATKYYVFRHHLETQVADDKELKDITWIRITSLNKLKNIVKVRVNNIGQIVAVGEY